MNLLPGMLLGHHVIVQDLGKSSPLRGDRMYKRDYLVVDDSLTVYQNTVSWRVN